MKTFILIFIIWKTSACCVLGLWPWPQAFLCLALRESVHKTWVLGLGFFCVLGLGLERCVVDSTSADMHNLNESMLVISKNDKQCKMALFYTLLNLCFSGLLNGCYIAKSYFHLATSVQFKFRRHAIQT